MNRPTESRRGTGQLLAAALLVFGADAAASPRSFDPPASVCANGNVDKSLLVRWALDYYGVSRAAEDAAGSAPGIAQPPRVGLIADEKFCRWTNHPDGKYPCTDADASALVELQIGLLAWLGSPGDGFDTSHVPPDRREAYLLDGSLAVACIDVAAAKHDSEQMATSKRDPEKKAGSPNLRVRGSVDGLRYDKGAPDYADKATKASLSIQRDDAADKTVHTIVGVVGYRLLQQYDTFDSFEFIPYFGINRNVTDAAGKSPSVAQNTRDVGVYIDGSVISSDGKFDQVFVVRPDFLSDVQHHSRIESLNATYRPLMPGGLNTYFRLVPQRADFVSVSPLFDLRLDAGHHQNCGTLKAGDCANFTRLGAQFGVLLASDNPNVPLTASLTDTRLVALGSRSHDIDYVKGTLSWSFNTFTSLDLSYSDGRREDTALEEKLWSFSVGVKY